MIKLRAVTWTSQEDVHRRSCSSRYLHPRWNLEPVQSTQQVLNVLFVAVLSIHSFIHSFILSFILSFFLSFFHSFIHSSIHSFIHSFIHSSIHLFIHSVLSLRALMRRADHRHQGTFPMELVNWGLMDNTKVLKVAWTTHPLYSLHC